MILGKLLTKNAKALRVSRGLSQLELASKTGLTVRYISRLENTAQNVTLDVLERLTKGLGCSLGELFGEEGHDIKGSGDTLDEAINLLQGLRSRL
jgi:transcriptional regulator with XRE-family HTH domain